MKDEDFVLVMGWMRNRLNLSGHRLMVYATIYSYSRDGESEFKGTRKYLAELAGTTTKTIDAILSELVGLGYLEKRVDDIGGVKLNRYRINFHTLEKISTPLENFSTPLEKIAPIGIYRDNNRDNNKESNNINIITKEKKFRKPSVDEVRAYCEERRNGIDGQRFCDYYESKGWMVGNARMKDWKAAVRTWERRDEKSNGRAAGGTDRLRNIGEFAEGVEFRE